MINNLRSLLVLHEGRRNKIYPDSEGYDTIGIGHLLDVHKGGGLPRPIALELERRGIDIYSGGAMPEDLIDDLFDLDLHYHERMLLQFQPWIDQLDEVRRAVMLDMTFNLGPEPFDNDGFKDWPVFLRQVREGRYVDAARNMLSTLWAKQVKTRARRLARMMETGSWPES